MSPRPAEACPSAQDSGQPHLPYPGQQALAGHCILGNGWRKKQVSVGVIHPRAPAPDGAGTGAGTGLAHNAPLQTKPRKG